MGRTVNKESEILTGVGPCENMADKIIFPTNHRLIVDPDTVGKQYRLCTCTGVVVSSPPFLVMTFGRSQSDDLQWF